MAPREPPREGPRAERGARRQGESRQVRLQEVRAPYRWIEEAPDERSVFD